MVTGGSHRSLKTNQDMGVGRWSSCEWESSPRGLRKPLLDAQTRGSGVSVPQTVPSPAGKGQRIGVLHSSGPRCCRGDNPCNLMSAHTLHHLDSSRITEKQESKADTAPSTLVPGQGSHVVQNHLLAALSLCSRGEDKGSGLPLPSFSPQPTLASASCVCRSHSAHGLGSSTSLVTT